MKNESETEQPKAPDNQIEATIEGFETEQPKAPDVPQVEKPAPTVEKVEPAERPANPIRVGARIRLIETRYGDEALNPVWGGSQGMTGGTVSDCDASVPTPWLVVWDNGARNRYKTGDLRVLTADEAALASDNPKLPRKEDKPIPQGPWPVDATKNREAWLHEASRRISRNGAEDLRGVLFSVGFGKGGTRGAKNWSVIENAASDGWQVFIRPNVADKVLAMACTIDALRALGVRLWPAKQLAGIGVDWPDYPQPDVTHEHKQQATRLIKCWCKACGYTVRTTQRWLTTGAPLCPCQQPPIPMEVAK